MRQSRIMWATIGANVASLAHPYATEGGGPVPLYSKVHGRIQKRNWAFKNPSWCQICREPISLWVNHMGRKDHSLLDAHYTQIVEWPRKWDAEKMLREFAALHGLPIESLQGRYSKYDQQRRGEIFAITQHLAERNVLSMGDPKLLFLNRMQGGLRGVDQQGALVLHQFILGPFMRLYPEEHIQNYSNLVDFCTCAYNLETVYDLCSFSKLDKISTKEMKVTSPGAMGMGGQGSAFGNNQGAELNAGAGKSAETQTDAEYEEAFSRKASFIRSLFGQLRWVTSNGREHPAGKKVPHDCIVLCEILVKALVAEIIACRLCEYIIRVEPIWREYGFERQVRDMPKRVAEPLVRDLIRYHYRPMQHDGSDLYTVPTSSGPSSGTPHAKS